MDDLEVVLRELCTSLRATAVELSAKNAEIGTSSDTQTSELRLFKREAERVMRGFVNERAEEAARLGVVGLTYSLERAVN